MLYRQLALGGMSSESARLYAGAASQKPSAELRTPSVGARA